MARDVTPTRFDVNVGDRVKVAGYVPNPDHVPGLIYILWRVDDVDAYVVDSRMLSLAVDPTLYQVRRDRVYNPFFRSK